MLVLQSEARLIKFLVSFFFQSVETRYKIVLDSYLHLQ